MWLSAKILNVSDSIPWNISFQSNFHGLGTFKRDKVKIFYWNNLQASKQFYSAKMSSC